MASCRFALAVTVAVVAMLYVVESRSMSRRQETAETAAEATTLSPLDTALQAGNTLIQDNLNAWNNLAANSPLGNITASISAAGEYIDKTSENLKNYIVTTSTANTKIFQDINNSINKALSGFFSIGR